MSIESTATSETTENTPITTENAPEAPVTDANTAEGAEKAIAGEAAPWVPDYKIKTKNKEFEIDEWARAAIKDKDTEQKAKDLWLKADGLDEVKESRDKARTQTEKVTQDYTRLQSEHTPLKEDVATFNKYLANKDLDSAFHHIGLTEEQVLQWAIAKAKLREAGPEARAQWESEFNAKRQAHHLETENAQLRNSFQQREVALLQGEISQVLQKPDVVEATKAFNQRAGQPNAFFEELQRRGDYYFQRDGVIKNPQEIVDEIVKLYGLASPQAAGSQGQAATEQSPGVVIPGKQKPTLPNISGTGGSPAKKVVTGMADIAKRLKELEAEEE